MSRVPATTKYCDGGNKHLRIFALSLEPFAFAES
jgi:hypothetical protein